MLNRALDAGLNMPIILTAIMPMQAIDKAPPHCKNYSEGAMYAIPASELIDRPVARAASATTAIVDIWIIGRIDNPMQPVMAV